MPIKPYCSSSKVNRKSSINGCLTGGNKKQGNKKQSNTLQGKVNSNIWQRKPVKNGKENQPKGV